LQDIANAHSESCTKETGPDCFVQPTATEANAGLPAGRSAATAVFQGVLRLPEGTAIPFQYVKLAVDEGRLDQYPKAVRQAIKSKAASKAKSREARESLFPHIPTKQQKLSTDDFRALRLLGCHLVEQSFAAERKPPAQSPCQPK
jgi:hypothetical protein